MSDINPNKTTIFTTPIWGYDFVSHSDFKADFIETIDSYADMNSIVNNELSSLSIQTVSNLHQNPIFRPLVDRILQICSDLKTEFHLEDSVGLGLRSMFATKTQPKGFQTVTKFNNALLQGFYFIETPKNSGILNIYNPCPEPSYFLFGVTNNSTFNQEKYRSLMPEGAIILLPSHLNVDITLNESDAARTIIHFCICTV